MNLTFFSVDCPFVRSHNSVYHECILDISLPNRTFYSFSECLNAMPGVLVAGSERRGDKNKEI